MTLTGSRDAIPREVPVGSRLAIGLVASARVSMEGPLVTKVGYVNNSSPGQAVIPPLPLHHLSALTGQYGLYARAVGSVPNDTAGYDTADAARLLAFAVREKAPTNPDAHAELSRLIDLSLSFLEAAVSANGTVYAHKAADGSWSGEPTYGEAWGMAVYGLGAAVRHAPDLRIRSRALRVFFQVDNGRSLDARASAYAAIGAADVWDALPGTLVARILLDESLVNIEQPREAGVWPEASLGYANGVLCTALIVGGSLRQNSLTVNAGLNLLSTLLQVSTSPTGRLSFGGAAVRERSIGAALFGQQPVEAASIAEACAAAYRVTKDAGWAHQALRAWTWFEGENDAKMAMFDPATGAGFDGLDATGRSANQSAEATLSALDAYQTARTIWL